MVAFDSFLHLPLQFDETAGYLQTFLVELADTIADTHLASYIPDATRVA
jgi:hypothetical protein